MSNKKLRTLEELRETYKENAEAHGFAQFEDWLAYEVRRQFPYVESAEAIQKGVDWVIEDCCTSNNYPTRSVIQLSFTKYRREVGLFRLGDKSRPAA